MNDAVWPQPHTELRPRDGAGVLIHRILVVHDAPATKVAKLRALRLRPDVSLGTFHPSPIDTPRNDLEPTVEPTGLSRSTGGPWSVWRESVKGSRTTVGVTRPTRTRG